MELSNPSIKKFLILQETKTPKKLLIFSQEKAFLIFQKTEAPKKFFYLSLYGISHISGNGTFLYFRK